MIIALFPNEKKQHSLEIATEVATFLKDHQIEVFAQDSHCERIGAQPLSRISPDEISFCISLGGDGTMIRLMHRHPHLNAPLLGINLGSLGFLADIPLNDIYTSLSQLLEGRYTIQKRMVMDGFTSKGDKCFAINEIVVHRAQNPSLIDLAIYVDGNYLNTFSADGMIISTPSGSTAYSLAAGGPIVSPELDAFIITPICPHTISNRPLVLMPKKDIQIKYLSSYLPVEVSYDGISSFNLEHQEMMTITPSSQRFPLVNLANYDYFLTLRKKLGWQGQLKNSF